MTARQVLFAYLGTLALYGLLVGLLQAEPPKAVDLAFTLLLWVLPYVWYYRDAEEQGFARSTAWGTGVILLALVAVPIYLVRSRQPGRKLKALGAFLGVLVLTLILPLAVGLGVTLLADLL